MNFFNNMFDSNWFWMAFCTAFVLLEVWIMSAEGQTPVEVAKLMGFIAAFVFFAIRERRGL